MLFMSDIAWAVLKMVYIGLMVSLQDAQKILDTLWPMGGKFSKRILTYFCYTKYNEVYRCHSNIQKRVS